jgi:tetratricopeptide (TPR) repeat protein
MNKRLFLLLFIVALAAALFLDIRLWRSADADARQAYNRGISRYRQGDLVAALGDFQAAAVAKGQVARQAALYNLGTTRLQLAAPAGGAVKPESAEHLRAAVRCLDEAADLDPVDADAVHNLAIARERLAALQATATSPPTKATASGVPGAEQRQADTGRPPPASPAAGAARPGAATALDGEGTRRRAETLPRDQALRMLDEGRGRELLPSTLVAAGSAAGVTPPEKDW